jgi:hypothetical protein
MKQMRKEVVVVCVKVLSQHLSGLTEESHDILQSGQSASKSDIESGTTTTTTTIIIIIKAAKYSMLI